MVANVCRFFCPLEFNLSGLFFEFAMTTCSIQQYFISLIVFSFKLVIPLLLFLLLKKKPFATPPSATASLCRGRPLGSPDRLERFNSTRRRKKAWTTCTGDPSSAELSGGFLGPKQSAKKNTPGCCLKVFLGGGELLFFE